MEELMRTTLRAFGLAGIFALACVSGAQAQFAEHQSRHGNVVKCYREFVIGPYRCHYFHNPLLFLH
jgi:hypothetical protein